MQTMPKYQHMESGTAHPYAHRLRLKPTTSYIQSLAPQRSLTVTNLQITPRTVFEMDRPQTQGSPRVVFINTSFRTAFPCRNPQQKRIPTFPKLATDPPNRQSNVSRLTTSSLTTTNRRPSGNSFRRENSSVNRYSARMGGQERENSSRSSRRQAQSRTLLTQRQSNTFAAYAKYNEVVKTAKAREKEKASESLITSNINDLSALVAEKIYRQPELTLTNEKQVWISDWIASTSAAMRLDDIHSDDAKVTKTLSVIHEQ